MQKEVKSEQAQSARAVLNKEEKDEPESANAVLSFQHDKKKAVAGRHIKAFPRYAALMGLHVGTKNLADHYNINDFLDGQNMEEDPSIRSTIEDEGKNEAGGAEASPMAVDLGGDEEEVIEYAFSTLSSHLIGRNCIKDLAAGYTTNDFLEDYNVKPLAQYEYALLTGQSINQARQNFNIEAIADNRMIIGWSAENRQMMQDRIDRAIGRAVNRQASFLMVADGLHWVGIGLLPCFDEGILKVIYLNPAYGVGAERYTRCKITGIELIPIIH